MTLKLSKNIYDQDAAYAALIGAHQGLSEAQSIALNARLVLILCNHIGDLDIIKQAIQLATKETSKEN